MSRPLRNQAPDLVRHVMARGNGRMAIFLDNADYRHFLQVMGGIIEGFRIRCLNYCLMPNHYHATLQPTLANLSEAIRRINADYAIWWNKRHGRVGHVFQGRFKAQIVDYDDYFLTLSRYVVMNPVRAGLVSGPDDWPWSSYRATVGLDAMPSFLDVRSTLGLFGDGSPAFLQARYREAVWTQPDDPAPTDRVRSDERILGALEFKERVGGQTRV